MGGRSGEHGERQRRAGRKRTNAPMWTVPAAVLVVDALKEEEQAHGRRAGQNMLAVLMERGAVERLLQRLPAGAPRACRDTARSVLHHHQQKLAALHEAGVEGGTTVQRLVDQALQTMRLHAAKYRPPGRLRLEGFTRREGASLDEFLSQKPEDDRAHDVGQRRRVIEGLQTWDLSWMTGHGVICYERHAGRIKKERPECAKAPGRFLQGVVRSKVLPTAVRNRGNHYLLVSAGGPVRLLSVEENARAMGIPAGSPVMVPLLSESPLLLTALQAVEALGSGVHVGVVRALMRTLIRDGELKAGLRYGSAFSGLDLAAAALDEELQGKFEYVFASEREGKLRRALVAAWAARGLTLARCYADARDERARSAPDVDLWVATPSCTENSRLNRVATDTDRARAAADFDMSLDYVRRRKPRVVIVENVSESSAVLPLTWVLTSIPGYAWSTGVLDPYEDLGEPVRRERQYWVGRCI